MMDATQPNTKAANTRDLITALRGQALRSIQTLIEVFRADPHAIYRAGGPPRTMRQVLSDEASSLDSCDPEDAHQLDRALAAG